ncbi:MAG: DUF3047 domain-containing protein [Elusimicrobia bacterium]|nr:DUF3047 domain-containing protein [Elusimicrobiota bacterium]
MPRKKFNFIRRRWLPLRLSAICLCVCAQASVNAPAPGSREISINVSKLKVFKRNSGPVNYYKVINNPDGAYIHSAYKWPLKTAVLYYSIPKNLRGKVSKIRWKWRAVTLPNGGDECAAGRTDSAAVVYLVWRRGAYSYSLKYVWSAAGIPGKVCDYKHGIFHAQKTIIVESGQGTGDWHTMELDPAFEFRKYLAGGNAKADVPDIDGFGIMSDGDQTKSPSEADFGGFSLTYR